MEIIEEVSSGETVVNSPVTAVAVRKDSNSRHAVKWALDTLMLEGGTLLLIHVRPRVLTIPTPLGSHVPIAQVREDAVAAYMQGLKIQINEMLLPFQQLCKKKKVQAEVVVVEEDDVPKAIVEQISNFSISRLVIGSSARNAFIRRFKGLDVPAIVAKNAPKVCTVYVISKGKLISVRSGVSLVPKGTSPEDVRSRLSWCSDLSRSSSPSEGSLSRDTGSESEESSQFYSQPLPLQRNQSLPNVSRIIQRSISNPQNMVHNTETSKSQSNSGSTGEGSISFGRQTSGIFGATEFLESGRFSLSRNSDPISEECSISNTEERGSPFRNTQPQRLPSIQEFSSSMAEIPFMENDGFLKTTTRDQGVFDIPSSVDGCQGTSEAEAAIISSSPREIHENDNLNIENKRPQMELISQDPEEALWKDDIQIKAPQLENQLEVVFELERLKVELKHALGMYSVARKEAIDAKLKAEELHIQRIQEAIKLEEARVSEEQAKTIALQERAKSEAAIKEARVARQVAEKEAQQRRDAELRAIREAGQRIKAEEALACAYQRYRRYSIEEIQSATDFFSESLKIGGGGYGDVYKCNLHHTTVAIKVLRPEATQGIQQFQQEVEVLSRIRHPHMVLLVGACSEHECLVYEYMANGSLDDRLFCKNNSPPLPWFIRFRIAWEVASALLFLHSTKPEPIVHRDMKPANILLDHNFVSKIGDVGLARIVPPVATTIVTEYKDTSPAGTFCYIDPEYQRTGTLGPKSDLYALGIILLQLLTAKLPMAITYAVETAIENGLFEEILDKTAGDWPQEEALELAMLGLRCAELRRRDRPDLEKEVLPSLTKFKDLAITHTVLNNDDRDVTPPSHFLCPILQEVMEDPYVAADGFTYEFTAIKTWLESNNTSPMTNISMAHKNLIPNHSLRSAILEWQSK